MTTSGREFIVAVHAPPARDWRGLRPGQRGPHARHNYDPATEREIDYNLCAQRPLPPDELAISA